jgi:hypothetical protein
MRLVSASNLIPEASYTDSFSWTFSVSYSGCHVAVLSFKKEVKKDAFFVYRVKLQVQASAMLLQSVEN